MEEVDEPVSPTGQYLNSSVLSISILATLEFDIPIDASQTYFLLNTIFLPINPRFSSLMVRDENGVKQWKKVEVKLEDHVHVPIFPDGLSSESYVDYLQEYLSKIAMESLPQSRPLWEIHLIKYPTSNADGTLVFKLHHALVDGFSLMGALFSCLRRADNPSLPLTFPSSKQGMSSDSNRNSFFKKVTGFLSRFLNTTSDFPWSILKSSFVEDDRTPIRAGHEGVEFRPISISTVTFSLDQIKQIKDKLGGTTAQYVHSTLKNTSMVISNMIGPMEQMSLANHPIRGLYFMVVGSPQSLTVTIVSYMGQLRVAVGAEKGFIDDKMFTSCLENAFTRIKAAVCTMQP
ncbi:wax ester synthase/diacylglycerol acyltransferase 4-like [Macadamia integrifolia]|uniref:wax ester synthase/diacylglycerol acyltransferase 4-like n=1 Tax=Macadamia integrifolia TaxID=60698 RepID=UPI001C4FF55A|nr:wax ester synthase/diacylglycerol acyltransferase 4-like [Macadamia integrifolia]